MTANQRRFNLIDEPWIPVADSDRVSLKQLFQAPQLRALGGNPVQKLAVIKLLLAIAQAACTPENESEWIALGQDGTARRCLTYLEKWHDRFYLYGDRPFLQMPAINTAACQSFGAVLPEISTGNTTVLSQGQVQRSMDDGERALLILVMMAFALGGKKTDNSVVLTEGYAGKRNDKGKPSTSKPGPAVAYFGLLHTHLLGQTLHETLWLNLITRQQIQQTGFFPGGVGIAPWEQMPQGEDCAIARALKQSLMGRLIPVCRFCLLAEQGFHYSEGIAHANYKEGMSDPSVAVDYSGKEPRALWVDPEKRPWRELTSLLSFIAQSDRKGFECIQIQVGLDRARDATQRFALWSAGLRVSSNAGEQFVSGSDDFVESQVWLNSGMLGQTWFTRLKQEMDALDQLAKSLYGRVLAYFKEQKVDGAKLAAQATALFWQLCEQQFQALVNNCYVANDEADDLWRLRTRFSGYAHHSYNEFCPNETARQLDAWAKCRLDTRNYLRQESN
jgi:CRISPR system Cascade subunit CasA